MIVEQIILSYMESRLNQKQESNNRLTLKSKPQDFFGINSAQWPIDASDPLSKMTLRDLLSFTSGLVSEPFCITPGNGIITMEECVQNIALKNKGNGKIPGSEFYYNGNHLQVAGLMAVAARNKALGIKTSTWQDLFNDFKTRTGLFKNSTYDLPSELNPRLAGGMHWTGSDYLAFLKANYYKSVLSPEVMEGELLPYWQLQRADQIANATIGHSPAIERIGEDWHYGLGLWLQCHWTSFRACPEATSWASPGTYGAFPFLDAGNKFYGIIARQGDKVTFDKGYAIFEPVNYTLGKWARKDCGERGSREIQSINRDEKRR